MRADIKCTGSAVEREQRDGLGLRALGERDQTVCDLFDPGACHVLTKRATNWRAQAAIAQQVAPGLVDGDDILAPALAHEAAD